MRRRSGASAAQGGGGAQGGAAHQAVCAGKVFLLPARGPVGWAACCIWSPRGYPSIPADLERRVPPPAEAAPSPYLPRRCCPPGRWARPRWPGETDRTPSNNCPSTVKGSLGPLHLVCALHQARMHTFQVLTVLALLTLHRLDSVWPELILSSHLAGGPAPIPTYSHTAARGRLFLLCSLGSPREAPPSHSSGSAHWVSTLGNAQGWGWGGFAPAVTLARTTSPDIRVASSLTSLRSLLKCHLKKGPP